MSRFRLIIIVLIFCVILVPHEQEIEARPNSATIGNCPLFPPDNPWNRNISSAPLHPNSANYIASINAGSNKYLRAGFGLWPEYGMPYVVVPGSQPRVPITFTEWGMQSDPGPYPIPLNAPVEGLGIINGDRHVIAVDKDNCKLYELHNAYRTTLGWQASSGAVFDLRSNALRPEGWTSADAAGLPIFPGLIRYDEIATGAITHALRITVWRTQRAYVYPARHFSSPYTDPNLPPMGLRLRLKASFNTSGYSSHARIILEALKKYGVMIADEGQNFYVSGTSDPRWDRDSLETLRTVPITAFEAVQVFDPNPPVPNIRVRYKAGNTSPYDNTLSPHFRVTNNTTSPVPVNTLRIRYYFTRDGSQPLVFYCDFAFVNCANVRGTFVTLSPFRVGADTYLELAFPTATGSIPAGVTTGEIKIRVMKGDWATFNETNDYSWDGTRTDYVDWLKSTLHYNGAQVWGNMPGAISAPSPTPTRVAPTFVPNTTVTPTRIAATSSPVVRTPTPAASPTRTPTARFYPLKIQYMAGEVRLTDNQMGPYFQVANNTGSALPLGGLTIRYWFTRDTAQPLVFHCDYAAVGCANIQASFVTLSTPRPGADAYLQITFTSGAGSVPAYGKSGIVQTRINKADWSAFDESNDYSFDRYRTSFADWPRVTMYQGGALIWGVEP